jgi:hypothetical protein
MNEKYRIAGSKGRKEVNLDVGDLVWLHLSKDIFLELRKSKLMPRAAGPFKIIENAYKLELPPEFRISPTFNIADLQPYLGEENKLASRTTSLQEGEDDEDITSLDTNNTSHMDMQGPITLNLEMSSFLYTFSNFENSMLPNDVIVLRNKGEDQEVFGGRHGGGEDQTGRPSQAGGPQHPVDLKIYTPGLRVLSTKLRLQTFEPRRVSQFDL